MPIVSKGPAKRTRNAWAIVPYPRPMSGTTSESVPLHVMPTARWRGEQMDYDLGVAVLVQQSHRPRRVSAETPSSTSPPSEAH